MMRPQLRFKEFNDDWKKREVGEIAKVKGGYAFQSKRFGNERSKYQVIKMGNLYKNELRLERSPSYIEKISPSEEEYLLGKGDIILTLTGTVNKTDYGYSFLITDEQNKLLNQRLALVKCNDSSTSSFLINTIRHKRFLWQFFKSSSGGTGNQANVSTKNIEQFTILIPSISEQRKIGDFFTLLDRRIEQQQEKVEVWCEYKKGMMQKLFSQKLRFKDENEQEFPEWMIVSLNLVSEINPKSEALEDSFQYIDLESVKAGQLLSTLFVNKEDAPSRAQRVVRKGDILYQTVRPYQHNNLFYNHNFEGQVVASTGYAQIKTSDSILNNSFLYQYLNTDRFTDNVLKRCTGTSYPAINSSDLGTIEIPLPCLKEQKSISTLLSAIDSKVEVETKKVELLQEQKKGFMQQMFI